MKYHEDRVRRGYEGPTLYAEGAIESTHTSKYSNQRESIDCSFVEGF